MYLMDAVADTAMLVNAMPKRTRDADAILKVFPHLHRQLQGAPRYLFDENAIHMAVELSLGRPKVLLEAMRHLRIPYQRLWIEWPESGRQKLRETFDEGNYTSPTRPLPERLGFLLECDETGRKGQVTWLWTSTAHKELQDLNVPNIAAISPYFDLDARIEQDSSKIAGFLRGNLAKLWADHPVQLEALFDIWRTASHEPSEWGAEYCLQIQQLTGDLKSHLRNMWADVYGEYIIIWACLLLITSSRKAVDYRPVDRTKLNKIRQKRKQPLLFDHTEVVLHIGPDRVVQGQHRQPLSYKRKSPRIHMVSSFLNRRGDKHWIVQPFMRGSGETISRHVHVRP